MSANEAEQARNEMIALLQAKRSVARFFHAGIPVDTNSLNILFENEQYDALLQFLQDAQAIKGAFAGQPLVVPGEPSTSAFFLHITRPEGVMFGRFSDEEAATVERWILSLEPPDVQEVALQAKRVVTGLSEPVFVTSPPGDSERLFVVERATGRIRIVDLATGALHAEPFLTLTGHITDFNEQGLLGLTFHPNYADN